MPAVLHFGPFIFNSGFNIPPGGSQGFWISNVPTGVVSLSAYGLRGLVTGPQSLTVTKLTTRTANPADGFIDFTVRNDSPGHCPFVRVVVSVIMP